MAAVKSYRVVGVRLYDVEPPINTVFIRPVDVVVEARSPQQAERAAVREDARVLVAELDKQFPNDVIAHVSTWSTGPVATLHA